MSAEQQVASFFAKYEPTTAALGKALRTRLRERLPGLLELVYVYERQDSLVISYSPTEAGADGVCAIAVYPGQVKLFLTGGDRLAKSDPKKLLQGRGTMVRHVVMHSLADFERPEIEALLAAALTLAKVRLDASAKGAVVLKVEAQKQRKKQRERGAAKAARTAGTAATAGARRGGKTRAGGRGR